MPTSALHAELRTCVVTPIPNGDAFIKIAICGFLISVGLCAAVNAAPRAAGAPGEPIVYKKVDGRELRLFVVKPEDWKASDQRPAVVFFHGGGWVGGSPGQFSDQCQYLATRGLVCVQVEYRLLDKRSKGPPVDCCRDAKSSMRWVRSHAKDLGIDPNRIASGGGSAGGHLAAFVGMVDGNDDPADDNAVSPRSNAMLLFNPVFDNGPGGWGAGRVGDRYKEFSPVHNITAAAPPTIVFLGTKDNLIPVATVERFKTDMQKAGVRADTFFYDGQPHGFFNKDPWKTKTLLEVDRFLVSLGWLKGEPTLKSP